VRLQLLAVARTPSFAGAAICINVAEHPARMECGIPLATTWCSPIPAHARDPRGDPPRARCPARRGRRDGGLRPTLTDASKLRSTMFSRIVADLVLLLHFGFVAFVVFGGLLVLRRPIWAGLHVPAVLWGTFVECTGAICPLTPLEIAWRQRGGEAGYPGGFLEHYVTAVLYPAGLTRELQIGLGILVVVINAAIYSAVVVHHRRRTRLARGD
jgi:hypothetical protein